MAYTANKLRAATERRMVDFDPDATAETIVTLNPAASEKCLSIASLGGLQGVLAGLFRSVGTGAATSFRIFVADNAAGTTNAANVVSHALGSAPDAVGDTLWLEASAEQIRAASATALYVGVKVTLATGTDECVIAFERLPRQIGDNLTADYVS
jgi:hypothetical protein